MWLLNNDTYRPIGVEWGGEFPFDLFYAEIVMYIFIGICLYHYIWKTSKKQDSNHPKFEKTDILFWSFELIVFLYALLMLF